MTCAPATRPGYFGQDLATCRAQTDACWCADDYLVRSLREDDGYWREDRSITTRLVRLRAGLLR